MASSGLLVASPSASCPTSVEPSLSFHGFGSGTWGSIALAVGMGAPVQVFIQSSFSSLFPDFQSLAYHFSQLGFVFGGYWWLVR